MGVRPRGPKIPQAEISQIPESGWGDLFDRFLNTWHFLTSGKDPKYQ